MGFHSSLRRCPLDYLYCFWRWRTYLGTGATLDNFTFSIISFQVIATIPSSILPKFFAFGRGEVQPTSILVTGEYDIPEVTGGAIKELGGITASQNSARPGQLLWLLGLTRLQTQVTEYSVLGRHHRQPFFHTLFLLIYIFRFVEDCGCYRDNYVNFTFA